MMNLKGEQLALIATAIVSLISAIAVARINKQPEIKKEKRDKYEYFYNQHQSLYDTVVGELGYLQEQNNYLKFEIKKLEGEIKTLEKTIEGYEQNLKDEIEDKAYWKEEAKAAYDIIDKHT